MSKLKILVAGDPVLRQKAQEVERMDKKLCVFWTIWQKQCMPLTVSGLRRRRLAF